MLRTQLLFRKKSSLRGGYLITLISPCGILYFGMCFRIRLSVNTETFVSKYIHVLSQVMLPVLTLMCINFRLSWFTVYGVYVLLLSVICIIVLPLAKVFVNVNLFLLFILFILYGCSSIMFGFMMTPFFNKAKVPNVNNQFCIIFVLIL